MFASGINDESKNYNDHRFTRGILYFNPRNVLHYEKGQREEQLEHIVGGTPAEQELVIHS